MLISACGIYRLKLHVKGIDGSKISTERLSGEIEKIFPTDAKAANSNPNI